MSLLIAFNLYKSLFPIKASYNNIYEFMLRLRFFLIVLLQGLIANRHFRAVLGQTLNGPSQLGDHFPNFVFSYDGHHHLPNELPFFKIISSDSLVVGPSHLLFLYHDVVKCL